MPSVLITGANRGLGLELVRQYAADGWKVMACCRKPKSAKALLAVKGDVEIRTLDVASPASINRLAKGLKGKPTDILINNAGIAGRRLRFGKTDPKDFLDIMRVNAVAPLMLTEALIANVAKSKMRKIVAITSRMGSIGDHPSGDSFAYRCSKSALNMAMVNSMGEFGKKNIALVLLHPGWVKTDMGGKQAPVAIPDSVAGMRRVIADLGMETSGRFLNYKGETLPW